MFRMGQNERTVSEATAALAAAIREAQGLRNLDTKKLSARSGVPYSTLRKIRSGNQPIDFEELSKIARGLAVSPSALAERAEELLGGPR